MNLHGQQSYIAISLTVLMSLAYHLLLRLFRKEGSGGIRLRYFFRKVTGFALYGLVPIAVVAFTGNYDSMNGGLFQWNFSGIGIQFVLACLIIVALNFFIARDPGIREVYPELRLSSWSAGDILLESSGWIIYLSGYEFLIRGLLLFSCVEAFGTWPAVVVNLLIYSLLHLPKGIKEMLAAIPFGIVLCYFTLKSGSILPAVILHAVQAISCEMFAIYYHPGLKFELVKQPKP